MKGAGGLWMDLIDKFNNGFKKLFFRSKVSIDFNTTFVIDC